MMKIEVAIFDKSEEEATKSKIKWKKLEEIKIEEEEIKEGKTKIGFKFEEAVAANTDGTNDDVEEGSDEKGYFILWKISKNLAELIKFDTENSHSSSSSYKNDMILDSSISILREKFPRNIIFTQNLKQEFSHEQLIRNGFYLFNDSGYGIFPPLNFYPEDIQALAEEDSELKNIGDRIIKVLKIFNENEKFGRSFLQEQFEPYFWRHCIQEPLFWGLRNSAVKFFLELISSNPISLDSFNQGNFLFSSSSTSNASSVSDDDEDVQNTIKWCSKMFCTIKGRLNAFIYSQIFAETPQQYRQLFATVCHEIGKLLIFQGDLQSALKILDEGIMKGIQFDDNNLGKLAFLISSKLPTLPKIEICRSLYPIPNPSPNSQPVPILVRPSLEQFLQYLDRPVVIKDFVQHFPLFQFFDFEYLNNVHGYRRVPIEFGSSYAGEDYSQKIVTIHEYLRDFLTSEDSPKAYLAQHALLDQLDLLSNVPIPDYASLLPSDKDPLVNVFIGPSGTISPLHFDPRPNFFCQIRGRKFVRLVNPKYRDDVYLNPDPMFANSSVADFENLDFEQFPRLKEIEMEDVILEEGECLFMPEKYFHLMRSLSPSISVSIWI